MIEQSEHRAALTLRAARRWTALRTKAFLGWILFGSRLYRLLWKERAVIVVFHRVNDLYPYDPLTCTTTAFEQFTKFCARYFEVIPLTELLRRIESEDTLSPSLTITFDDGYRGNALIAAPILEQHNLRACFFVTTDFIGTTHIPRWDREHNIETKWMTWDEVRALRAAGHEIGSHTKTHVDLGVTPPEQACCEISGGNSRLVDELGQSAGLFAYPFGGRRNMSDRNRAIVAKAGLLCCLSAYGGTVKADDDPFLLKRVNIS
ncbi:MAG: polysaccharide deacetylase family protein, partial [Gemmatimonadaceae bacterium]